MSKEIDYLTEDEIIEKQLFVCMSFLSPEGIKNCNVRGLKIRGVYNTQEEANNRAEYLQKIDPNFHVFVGEVGKWLPWDPDPNSIKDHVYREKELNKLMKEYNKNLERTKEMEVERKQELQNNNNDNVSDRKIKIQERLRKKLSEKKNKNFNLGKKQINNENNENDNLTRKYDKKIKSVRNTEDEIKEQLNEKNILNQKLDRIKHLYNKLNENKEVNEDKNKNILSSN